MAKKKGDKGTARRPGKKNGKKRAKSQAGRRIVSAKKASDPADQDLTDGIASTQVMTAAVQATIDEAVKGNLAAAMRDALPAAVTQVIAPMLKSLQESVNDLRAKFDEAPKPVSQESIHKLAEDRIKRESVRIKRTEMWMAEWSQTDRKDSMRVPPRPSIIGRAIHELQTDCQGTAMTPAAIFERIRKRASHHLSATLKKLLARYRPKPNGNVDKGVSGDLGDQLEGRLHGLKAGGYIRVKRGQRQLSQQGLDVFDGWPDWSVRNDDTDCQGRADYASEAAQTAAGTKRPSASAPSE